MTVTWHKIWRDLVHRRNQARTILGVLPWLLAVPLSIPGARLFSEVIGNTVIHFPLDFAYSVDGVLLWLVIVVVLAALASLWPSLQATKVSVCEALAYE